MGGCDGFFNVIIGGLVEFMSHQDFSSAGHANHHDFLGNFQPQCMQTHLEMFLWENLQLTTGFYLQNVLITPNSCNYRSFHRLSSVNIALKGINFQIENLLFQTFIS